MLSGILIDGRKAQVDYAEFVDDENYPGIDPGTGTTGIRIGVHEGRKHLVKRICRAVGYSVLRLTRTKIGSFFGTTTPGRVEIPERLRSPIAVPRC